MKFTISNGMVCQNAKELLCTVTELIENAPFGMNDDLIITNENFVPMTVIDLYTEAETPDVLSAFVGEDWCALMEWANEPID